jgi:hypothetical protein
MFAHALVAGSVFFLFQYYGLSASLETGLLWAVVGGAAAAVLAWTQHNRGD